MASPRFSLQMKQLCQESLWMHSMLLLNHPVKAWSKKQGTRQYWVQGIVLSKAITDLLGGRAAETAPFPHTTNRNADFYTGVFPHLLTGISSDRNHAPRSLIWLQNKTESAGLATTQPSLKRGLTVSQYYAEALHCACHNGILLSCRTHPIKYSKTLLEEIQ